MTGVWPHSTKQTKSIKIFSTGAREVENQQAPDCARSRASQPRLANFQEWIAWGTLHDQGSNRFNLLFLIAYSLLPRLLTKLSTPPMLHTR
jgi:hypothetical protein